MSRKEFRIYVRLNIDYLYKLINNSIGANSGCFLPNILIEFTQQFEVVNFDIINLTGASCMNEMLNFRTNLIIICSIPIFPF